MHVKIVGEFLAPGCSDDAVGIIFVGYKRCSCGRRGLTNLNSGDAYGAGPLASHVDATSFCFRGG